MRVHHWGVLVCLAGCTQILDVPSDDDLGDLARALCSCEDVAKLYKGNPCRDQLQTALDGASEEEIGQFVQNFAGAACDQCANAVTPRCLSLPPICTPIFEEGGLPCVDRATCCGSDSRESTCFDGVCVACKPDGAECQTNEDCCESGSACQIFDGGTKACVRTCIPSDPVECPGCCLALGDSPDVAPPVGLCLPLGGNDLECVDACDFTKKKLNRCPEGQLCRAVNSALLCRDILEN